MLRPATAAEIPKIQEAFTEVWNMLKEFYNLKQDSDQDDWNKLLARYTLVCQICIEPAERELAKGLAQAVFKFIEYRSKVKDLSIKLDEDLE